MLQKIQTVSHPPCYLPSSRQNGYKVLEKELQFIFIWLWNTDIYPTNPCNQVQNELSRWKTSIKECTNQKITFDKAMLRNYQSVRTVFILWMFLKLLFVPVDYYAYFTLSYRSSKMASLDIGALEMNCMFMKTYTWELKPRDQKLKIV